MSVQLELITVNQLDNSLLLVMSNITSVAKIFTIC